MINVKNLTKYYGDLKAIDTLEFSVKKGAFFALLGPNGAGKSTTIEILSTLKEASSGDITIDGFDVFKEADQVRKAIGVVFQYSTLDDDLSVKENLMLRGAYYFQSQTALEKRIEILKNHIGIEAILNQKFKTLSGGQKRRVDVARALLHKPRLLLLDEPTTGLDPQARETLWTLILKLKREDDLTILLTTHYMQEVIDCDHVIILDEGKIIAENSAEALREAYAHDTLRIMSEGDALKKRLSKDKVDFSMVQNTIHIPLEDPFEGLSYIETYKPLINSFEIVKGDMDDVFLHLTGKRLGKNT
jgi:ABC-type multidrug transport system ATPase subunit